MLPLLRHTRKIFLLATLAICGVSLQGQPYVLTHTGVAFSSDKVYPTAMTLAGDSAILITGQKSGGKKYGAPVIFILQDTTGRLLQKSFAGGPGYTTISGMTKNAGTGFSSVLVFRDSLILGNSGFVSPIRSGVLLVRSNVGYTDPTTELLFTSFKGAVTAFYRDSANNLWIGGNFRKMRYENNLLASSGKCDAFLMKTSDTGNALYLFTGTGEERIQSILERDSTLIVTGVFSKSLTFGDTTMMTSQPQSLFIARMNPNGELLDFGSGPGAGRMHITSMVSSATGLYIGGSYDGALILTDTAIQTRGGEDGFLWKINPNGASVINTFGSSGDDEITALTIREGRIFAAVSFRNSLIFGSDTLHPVDRFSDALISEVDTAGLTPLWYYHLDGPGEQRLFALMPGTDRNLYAGGYSSGTLEVEGLTKRSELTGIFSLVFTDPCKWMHFGMPDKTGICENSSSTLDAGDYREYLWKPGGTADRYLTVSDTGYYSVTVTDSFGCKAIDSVYLYSDTVRINTDITNEILPPGDNGAIELNVNSGIPPYQILWSTGDTTQLLSGISAGIYSVVVTDSLGCEAAGEFEVEQEVASGIYDLEAYPNPFDEMTRIIYSLPVETRVEISLFDISGKKLFTIISARRNSGKHTFEWNRQNLKDGVYYLRIASKLGTISKKIVITHEYH